MTSVFTLVLLGSVMVFSPARAQERIKLLEDAALRENWQRVAELAGTETALSPVERMLVGHADLALNRNNELVASFLSVLLPDDLGAWLQFTIQLRAEHPDSPIACYLEGDALARLRQWPAAIDAFTTGLALSPRHALLLNARGVSYAAAWQMDKALVDLTTATKVNPRLADAYTNLGSYWVQAKAGAIGARQALDNALDISPRSVVALILRSGVLLLMRRDEAAQADVDLAAKSDESLAPAIQIRLLDMADSLAQDTHETAGITADARENPGTPIRRTLEQLQHDQPKSPIPLNSFFEQTVGRVSPEQAANKLDSVADFFVRKAVSMVLEKFRLDPGQRGRIADSAVILTETIIRYARPAMAAPLESAYRQFNAEPFARSVDEYMTYATSQAKRGLPVDNYTTHVGGLDVARRLGTPAQINQMDGLSQAFRSAPLQRQPISSSPIQQMRQPVTPDSTPKPSTTNPGGVSTKIELPRWQDGDWPFTPWYELGYVVGEKPAKPVGEVQK